MTHARTRQPCRVRRTRGCNIPPLTSSPWMDERIAAKMWQRAAAVYFRQHEARGGTTMKLLLITAIAVAAAALLDEANAQSRKFGMGGVLIYCPVGTCSPSGGRRASNAARCRP